MLAAAAADIPANTPVCMLNLLRYRTTALYAPGDDLPACSGRDAYFSRYVPAFQQVTDGMDIKPIFIANVLVSLLVPPSERWDDVAIVEYPNFNVLARMLESDSYIQRAEPHREAALEDWRFIAMARLLAV